MTMTTLRGHCGEGEECPGVHRLTSRSDLLFVVAARVDDLGLRADLLADAPEGALVGSVPRELLPEARADRDPYPWLRTLPGHPRAVFVVGSAIAGPDEAAMLAPRVGHNEIAMSVPAVALVEV